MKHVGEAVSGRTQIGHNSGKINCIGVAPWGQVDNAQFLVSKVCSGNYLAILSLYVTVLILTSIHEWFPKICFFHTFVERLNFPKAFSIFRRTRLLV